MPPGCSDQTHANPTGSRWHVPSRSPKSRLAGPPDMQPRIRAQLEWLQTELKALNLELHDRLQDHAAWQAQDKLLHSVPGMGPVVRQHPALRLERARTRAHDPLHDHRDRHPSQPRHPRLPHPFVPARQIPEGGARRGHAQAAPYPERRAPGPSSLATQPHAYGWRGLTFNTVAEQLPPSPPTGCPRRGCPGYACSEPERAGTPTSEFIRFHRVTPSPFRTKTAPHGYS